METYWILPHENDTGKDIISQIGLESLLVHAYESNVNFQDYDSILVYESSVTDLNCFQSYYYGTRNERIYLEINSEVSEL